MRRFLKFLHTISAIGLAGGLGAYMSVLAAMPEDLSLETFLAVRESLAAVSARLILPSMVVALTSGLLAMAVHFPFHNAPWVWVKAISGILIFEATLGGLDAPAQAAAAAAGRAVTGEIDAAELARLVRDEWGAWWVLLGLSAANVALAVWRPGFGLGRRR